MLLLHQTGVETTGNTHWGSWHEPAKIFYFYFLHNHTFMHFQLPQRHWDYLDQRIDKCLKLNQTMSETKPWSKNRLHLIFENIFNQMRKPQNNSDQSAFHLSAAPIDVQLILLMASLEENETTAYVTETIRHTHTQPRLCQKNYFHEALQITSIHSYIFYPLQVQVECHSIFFHHSMFLQLLLGDPRVPPGQFCGLSTESQVCTSFPFSFLFFWNLEGASSLHAWTTDCSTQSEPAAQLQGPAGSLRSSPCTEKWCKLLFLTASIPDLISYHRRRSAQMLTGKSKCLDCHCALSLYPTVRHNNHHCILWTKPAPMSKSLFISQSP